MFDVSFPELMVIAVVALLILGPERLPVALRTLGLWLGRLRRNFISIKTEVEREIGMDEVRRQLHNESIMHDLKRIEQEARSTAAVPARQQPPPAPAPKIDPSVSDSTVSENDRAPEASRQS